MSATAYPDSGTPTPNPTRGYPNSPTQVPDPVGATRPDWVTAVGIAVVGLSAIALSFTSLTGLGRLVGWGRLDFLLPLTIDAYAITATRVWLTRRTQSRKVRRFAAKNAVGAILFSVAGNAVFHALSAKAVVLGSYFWLLIVLVSAMPPIMIGLVSHMIALRVRDTEYAAAENVSETAGPEIAESTPTEATQPTPATPTRGDREWGNSPDPTATPVAPDVAAESGTESPQPDPDGDDELVAAATRLNDRWLEEKGRPVGVDTIRTEFRVGTARARKLRDIVQERPLHAVGE